MVRVQVPSGRQLLTAADVTGALEQAGKPQTARNIADTLGYGSGVVHTNYVRHMLEHMERDGKVTRGKPHPTSSWHWQLSCLNQEAERSVTDGQPAHPGQDPLT